MPYRKGFSLIEVSVSVILLAMVLIGCYRLISVHMANVEQAGQAIQAYYLADQGLAVVKQELNNQPLPSLGYATYGVDDGYHLWDPATPGHSGWYNPQKTLGGDMPYTWFTPTVTLSSGLTPNTTKISYSVTLGNQTATTESYVITP